MASYRDKYEALNRRWKDSGLTGCGSAPEFLLRMDAAGVVPDADDMEYLLRVAGNSREFRPVMVELVSGTDVFDGILSDLTFYIDYYYKAMQGSSPDPMKYGRVRALDMIQGGRIFPYTTAWDGADTAYGLAAAYADKVDSLFGGRLEHAREFRKWLDAKRRSGKRRA